MYSVLILIESMDPNDSSGMKGRLALINNLIKIGHQVKVIHLDENYANDVGFETKVLRRSKSSVYFWLTKLNTFANKFSIKLNKWIEPQFGFSFSHFEDVDRFKKALTKENRDNYDIVFTLSKAASFRPHKAVLESPNWHSRWYAYIHDPYPMHAYPRPYDWVEPGHQQKRDFFLEVCKKAHKLVYPSLYLAEWMESYYNRQVSKRIIIPHQIDDSLEFANTNKYFSKEFFVVLHAGNLTIAREPQSLIEAFHTFVKNNKEIRSKCKLFFVGNNDCYKNYLKDKREELEELEYTEEQLPFSDVIRLQKDASVNIILEASGPFSPFLPGKFAHCILADKPILLLSPFYSESKRIVDEFSGKTSYQWSEVNDYKNIYNSIEILYENWKKGKKVDFKKVYNYLSHKEINF